MRKGERVGSKQSILLNKQCTILPSRLVALCLAFKRPSGIANQTQTNRAMNRRVTLVRPSGTLLLFHLHHGNTSRPRFNHWRPLHSLPETVPCFCARRHVLA